jgi:recombination protein RecA
MSKTSTTLHKSLEKEYGEIFLNPKRLQEMRGEIIPTTLGLDIGLHGGIVEGTIIGIAGVSGSGKTTLLLEIAKNAQAMGKDVYYFDVEGRLQPELLKTIKGLDPNKIHIIRSTPDKFLTAEDYLNILNRIASEESGIFAIIDSVAALCADTVYSSKQGDSKKMMSIPQMMYDCMRRLAQILPAKKSNIAFITHVQANPSPYGGPAEVGGNAVKYFASYRITCLSTTETPKDGDKTGRESKFKILKAALGPGTGDATFYIRYHHGYNKELDIFTIAEQLGFINKAGAWYSFDNSKDELVKLQGGEAITDYLRNNPEEADYLETKIRDVIFKKD